MIYLISAFADILMIVAILLLINSVDNTMSRKNLIYAIMLCIFLSLITAVCYMQETKLYDAAAFIIYLIRYLIVIYIAYRRLILKYIYASVIYEFILNILISSIANMLDNVIELQFRAISSVVSIILNAVFIAVFSIFRKKIYFISRHIKGLIPRHLYALVLCAVLLLCGLSTLNNFPTESAAEKSDIMNFMIVVFTFIIVWIIISITVNVISKQHFSSMNDMLKKQVEIQIRHYDKLEKLNNEMRSFRHDYTNHLHGLRSLIEMNENDEAITYIGKLLKNDHRSAMVFGTGNRLADAILADKNESLSDTITIKHEGVIPPDIDNTDMCVILSNALDNAIEACSQLSEPGTISITSQVRQGYFVMTITNPTADPNEFTDIPETTKSDSEHHGIGLMNIYNVIKRHYGSMNIHCKDHIFELSVTLMYSKKQR